MARVPLACSRRLWRVSSCCVLHPQAQDINVAMQSPAGTQDAVTQQLVNAVGSGTVTRNLQTAGYGVNSAQISSINSQPYTPSGAASDKFVDARLAKLILDCINFSKVSPESSKQRLIDSKSFRSCWVHVIMNQDDNINHNFNPLICF